VRRIADFHMVFNLVLAALFIGPLNGFGALLTRLLPARPKPADASTPMHLDTGLLGAPSMALTCAAREVLRMGDRCARA
jgi:phosphate:Na+ symporter